MENCELSWLEVQSTAGYRGRLEEIPISLHHFLLKQFLFLPASVFRYAKISPPALRVIFGLGALI